jgi:peptidoglycan/xylan/chitin deacetylase (PgdA/CDA1 family)
VVALTFDDGPDPRGTPIVLEALARAQARATFFVLGECVLREPGLLAQVIAAGHDVEVHGHAHLRHPHHARAEIEKDLQTALNALHEHGIAPTRWRLPWGDLSEFSEALAKKHGLTLAGWTADSHDWRGDTAPDMLRAVEPRLEPRAVVLMHDGVGDGARRPDCRETAALIAPLVAAARARGLEPGRLHEPLPLGNPDFG